MSEGIDVSYHNGHIDWPEVKASGIDFVIIRVSHGMHSKDDRWEENFAAAREAGVKIGVYHYYYYADADKSAMETANFLSTIAGKVIELPAFIDLEEEGASNVSDPIGRMLDRNGITDRALAALDAIRAAGYIPGIYANSYWLKYKIDMSRIPEDVVIWCADWHGAIDYMGRVDIHQYSATGTVPGIGSGVDLDSGLVDFPSLPAVNTAPTVTPTNNPTIMVMGHGIGEHVVFATCYRSSVDDIPEAIQASKMKRNHGTITKIISGARNPYLLDDGMCWINDGDISGPYTKAEHTEIKASISDSISVGQKVTINGSGAAASDGTGTKVKRTNKAGTVVKRNPGSKYPNGTNYTSGSGVDAWFPDSALTIR